jgi:glycerol-3-phosphate dehydrogenase (NAD(P)+)
MSAKVGILGGGAWGTALAVCAVRAGSEALLWARDPATVAAINETRTNPRYLPDNLLPKELRATPDPVEAMDADAVLLAIPAQQLSGFLEMVKSDWKPGAAAVICAKGIDRATGRLMSAVVRDALGEKAPVAILSGPTFAAEVAAGLPAAVTLACADRVLGEELVTMTGSPAFRPYLTDDVIGAEIGGAVKNVLAIACGIVEGRRLGDNARAALVTRGLAEITRLCVALGGRRETMMGLSGLGDVTLTCNATQSRNFSFGMALGEGRSVADLLAEGITVEGAHSAEAVTRMAREADVDAPVSIAVDGILNNFADIDATIRGLMQRPFRDERA